MRTGASQSESAKKEVRGFRVTVSKIDFIIVLLCTSPAFAFRTLSRTLNKR
jgi:hypothetical protein